MGIFSSPAAGPNDKQYELRYKDGDRFRWDGQKFFTLDIAIQVANHEAGTGIQLYVTDPETEEVLWAGQVATR
jgi:hypothetical protein